MEINERETLIIQYNADKKVWEDVTKQVQWFDDSGNACRIKYFGTNTFYWKSWNDLKIFHNPQIIDLTNKFVYCDKIFMPNLSQLIEFGSYAKLFFSKGFTKLTKKSSIKIVTNIAEKREIKDLINYLKEVSVLMPTDDGKNFLFNQLDKLTVLDDSVLGKFLQGKLSKNIDRQVVIFPFDANSSQRIAVKRALEEDLSIIQGPPGTGKTETIRNIVANYISRGGSVAVVSGNNEATKNVKDKFESSGFGYLNAFLGNVYNIKSFFSQPAPTIKTTETIATEKHIQYLQATSNNIDKNLQYSLDIAKASQLISEYEFEKEINEA